MYANSVKDVVAQLPVLDFTVAKNFYCNEIGIRLVDEFDDLLIFLWNDAELHLWKCNEPLSPNTAAFMCVYLTLMHCTNFIAINRYLN